MDAVEKSRGRDKPKWWQSEESTFRRLVPFHPPSAGRDQARDSEACERRKLVVISPKVMPEDSKESI